jgi:Cu/Zn superoxide dismutase
LEVSSKTNLKSPFQLEHDVQIMGAQWRAAIVIHANEDDYKTHPAGNSGLRIACGIISDSRIDGDPGRANR